MTCDHRLGWPAAAAEDYHGHTPHKPFGLGIPARDWPVNQCEPWRPEGRYVTGRSSQCMTRGDVAGLEAQEGPQPPRYAPNAPKAMVTVPNDAGMRFTMPLLEAGKRPTLSPAAEWPFAGQGWRNEPQAVESFVSLHKQRQLEKLKAAEHERWLAAEEQRKRDAITACYSEKGCKA